MRNRFADIAYIGTSNMKLVRQNGYRGTVFDEACTLTSFTAAADATKLALGA